MLKLFSSWKGIRNKPDSIRFTSHGREIWRWNWRHGVWVRSDGMLWWRPGSMFIEGYGE